MLCQTPLHVKVGDRIIVRDHDLERTLGGGQVLELDVPETRRRATARRERLAAIRTDDAGATLDDLCRRTPVQTTAFARHWNLTAEGLNRLAQARQLQQLDGYLLHADLLAEATRFIDGKFAAHHRLHPDSPGLTADEACTGDASDSLTRRLALVARVESGTLRLDGGRYSDAGHRATVPANVSHLFETVRGFLDSIQPPSLGDIAKRLGKPFPVFEREMRALPAFDLAIRISETRYYLPARLLELAEIVRQLDTRAPFTVRQFRDASGVGRNVVIEVLEYFDQKGFTRRVGDTRRVVGGVSVVAKPGT